MINKDCGTCLHIGKPRFNQSGSSIDCRCFLMCPSWYFSYIPTIIQGRIVRRQEELEQLVYDLLSERGYTCDYWKEWV